MSRAKKVRAGDPHKAVAYLRTSKEEQKLGVQAQRAEIEAWAQGREIEIVDWQQEHVGGAVESDDRPGLIAAVAAVRAHGAGLLLMLRRDRLARDVYVAATIERSVENAGAHIVTVDGLASGNESGDKLIRQIMDAIAQYERSLISARTKAVAAVKKKKGESAGNPPYGWHMEGKKLVPNERERVTAEILFKLRNEGVDLRGKPHTVRWVAKQARALGLVSRKGKPLTHSLVARIIRMAPSLRENKP